MFSVDSTIIELDKLLEKGTGYVPDEYDPRDFAGEAFLGAAPVSFPDSFLIDVPFVTHQGGIPSCTAHAVTTMKWGQEGVRLSPRFNFAWTKFHDGYKGWGATFHNAASVLEKHGAIEEELYPDEIHLPESEYTNVDRIPAELNEKAKSHRSKAYVRLDRTKENIMRALMDFNSPVMVGAEWYQSYNRIGADGMLPDMVGSSAGHAFVAIGWRTVDGKWMLICQNSFGKYWGSNGRFYVTEENLMRLYTGIYATIDLTKEEAEKIDTEYKKTLNKPMIDLKKLAADKKTLIFDADAGVFYLNTGDKLLQISKERAAEAALMALTRAGFGLGVKTDYLKDLTIEQF